MKPKSKISNKSILVKNSYPQKSQWYKDFFQNFYLYVYKDILFSLPTEKEIDFIIDILEIPEGGKILDLCGGYGRIGLPLAKRGYQVCIQDLNKDFLNKAEKEAEKNKIKIKTVHSDMRKIPFSNEFDAIINTFNSFGYLENKAEDDKVLKSVYKALKPKGKFLIDIVNGIWLKNNYQTKTWRKLANSFFLEENIYDKEKNKFTSKILFLDLKKCESFSTLQNLNLYSFDELKNILLNNHFKIIKKFGGISREKLSSQSSKKIIILAKKN